MRAPSQVVAQWGRARSSRLTLPHYTARTPMFMPVGTQGAVKGLTSRQLEEIGCQAWMRCDAPALLSTPRC